MSYDVYDVSGLSPFSPFLFFSPWQRWASTGSTSHFPAHQQRRSRCNALIFLTALRACRWGPCQCTKNSLATYFLTWGGGSSRERGLRVLQVVQNSGVPQQAQENCPRCGSFGHSVWSEVDGGQCAGEVKSLGFRRGTVRCWDESLKVCATWARIYSLKLMFRFGHLSEEV